MATANKGRPLADHTGKRYNRLLVVRYTGQRLNGHAQWLCKCDCGKEIETSISELTREHGTKSCGCLRDENRFTHGLSKTPEYMHAMTLKHAYKITPEQVAQKLIQQNNKCAVCRREFVGTPWIDHDHSCCPQSKKTCGICTRGLLCRACNIGLGNFEDNVDFLTNAIRYLTEWRTQNEQHVNATSA